MKVQMYQPLEDAEAHNERVGQTRPVVRPTAGGVTAALALQTRECPGVVRLQLALIGRLQNIDMSIVRNGLSEKVQCELMRAA